MNKRKRFLVAFLGALGASQILWTYYNDNIVSGTVIYDPFDPEEKQDFIWHMEENNTPDEDVITLLNYLKSNELLEGDKLKVLIAELDIPGMEREKKEKVFNELFSVSVSMVDDGEETDRYFIHD